jgi:sugar (pentulose or hexulose) kinase
MTYLIGVDVGTQSVRSCLFDLKGTVVASATRPLATTYPKPAWAEQDAEAWWRGAVDTLREILQASRVNPKDVVGLSYDCTACTVVALAEDGTPLRPALLWMDERAHAEADEASATGHEVLRYCGGKVSPQWMIPKGRWLERHEPARFARSEFYVATSPEGRRGLVMHSSSGLGRALFVMGDPDAVDAVVGLHPGTRFSFGSMRLEHRKVNKTLK